MEVKLVVMALIGSLIGGGKNREMGEEGLQAVVEVMASAFLACLFVYFLHSFGRIDPRVLLCLSGFLGYLGELYTKELCLKALKRYARKE